MKVLHVIPSVAVRYGGPSSAIVPMCRSLAERGLDVCIATTDADGPGRLDVPIGTRTSWQGVPAVFFRRDWSEAYKYSGGLSRWLSQRVSGFDVVHVHAVLSHAPLAAATACRRAGVPYVVRPLGTLDAWSLSQKPLRKRFLLGLAGRRVLAEAAAIHYTSDEEKAAAEGALGLSRGVVIPLGIDPGLLTEPSNPSSPSSPYVLVMSRLHPVKNLEALIDAFADATVTLDGERGETWRLVIAGTGDAAYEARLKGLVALRGIDDRVQFAGWTSGADKDRLLRGAALFALPSFHENFGMSLIEALAAGVPALVSCDVHIGRAVVEQGAGWLAGTDRQSIAASLADALASAAEREHRGARARSFAARFAWPRIADKLSALYQRIGRNVTACVA